MKICNSLRFAYFEEAIENYRPVHVFSGPNWWPEYKSLLAPHIGEDGWSYSSASVSKKTGKLLYNDFGSYFNIHIPKSGLYICGAKNWLLEKCSVVVNIPEKTITFVEKDTYKLS